MKNFIFSVMLGFAALTACQTVSAREILTADAKKMLQFEHGKLDGFSVENGVLTLTPAPDNGIRVGILPVYMPEGNYKLTADITFPDKSAKGHAGFLLRRNGNKSCYLHLTPSGTYAGLTEVGPKLMERRFKVSPQNTHHLEVIVGGDCIYASINGELCFVAEKLEGPVGSAAFFTNRTQVQYSNVSVEPVSDEELAAAKVAKIDFSTPEKAKKSIIFEHGAPNSWKIADGKLILSPAPKNGVRLGVSPAAVPSGAYKITARLTFADPASNIGHAGFQVRRNSGSPAYIHVTPNGKYIGVTGVAPKVKEKIFKKASPDGVTLEITVRKNSMDIRLNGESCFNFDNLKGDAGGVAFNSWQAGVSFSDVKIEPVSESAFKPVEGALISTDFFRPARIQRRMRLHYGKKEDFAVSPNKVELIKNTNCVILGGTEGIRDFAISTSMQVGEGGTGGFLIRRDCGKQIYVFLGKNNSSVGVDKKSVSLPAELAGKPVRMDINCRGDNLTVKVNGTIYLTENNLKAQEGAVAMTNYGGNTQYYDLTVVDHNFFNTILPLD